MRRSLTAVLHLPIYLFYLKQDAIGDSCDDVLRDAERQDHVLGPSLVPPHSRVRPCGRRPREEYAQPEISDELCRGPASVVGLGCTGAWHGTMVVVVERLDAVFEEDAERLGAEETERAGLTPFHAHCEVGGGVQHAGDEEGREDSGVARR